MSAKTLMDILWVGWATVLFGGFVLGKPRDDNRRIPLLNRMSASLLLAVAAWVYHFALAGQALPTFYIALGMSLGLLGDLFMARLLLKNDLYLLAGMASFGAAHLSYILGIAWALHLRLFVGVGALVTGVAFWLMVAVILWDYVVYQSVPEGQKPSNLHYAVLAYSLLVASTAGTASAAFLDNAIWSWMALGAVLFLLSDTILAVEIFRQPKLSWLGDAVWLTYSPGQMMIVYAIYWGDIQLGV
ncbi:MAG: lysoplasmalogenase [Anaerolineae bacterium]|nr:lysoplasmalogenase [Anaerolineae bacterium]MDW8171542.1 lysoplasmalogenase [Anaerolineae bacterium]